MGVQIEFREATLTVGEGRTSRVLLRSFSHVFEPGTVTAVVGPSGSGKTSVLRAVLGERPLTAGSVRVGTRDVARLSTRARLAQRRTTVTVIDQDLNLVDTLTARENVELALRLAGSRDGARVADEWLERLGLADLRDMFPATLSGGEQQRVAIARALAGPHAVVLADEPTGALDEDNTRRVVAELRRFSEVGKTCVVVTHDPLVAAGADHVLHFHDGTLG